MNILFIGNSFTFRHDLNLLVEELVHEGKPDINIYTERVVSGGQSLFQHAEYYFSQTFIEQSTITNEEIQRRIEVMKDLTQLTELPEEFIHFWEDIRQQAVQDFPVKNIEAAISRHEKLLANNPRTKWDYVVVQTWKDEYPDMNDGFAKYAKQLGEIAREQGAKVIFYWTAPDFQNQEPVSEPVNQTMFEEYKNTMLQLAQEFQPHAVIPVPIAINTIQQGGTDLKFRYVNDGHPNQYTAYLTSNMFYNGLFKESTSGFTFNTVTETNPKGMEPGQDPDGNPATVVFEDPEKTYLQQEAYNAFTSFENLFQEDLQYIRDRPDWAGIWINTTNKTTVDLQGLENDIAGEAGRLKWEDIEPTQGNFDFLKLDRVLDRAVANDYYHYFVLWTGWHAPSWVFDNVPEVKTTRGTFPYYLDEDYMIYITNMFNALASYMSTLPQDKINRLAFIQPGFGPTGDRGLYKGDLLPEYSQYAISEPEYVDYMQQVTENFIGAFARYPQLSGLRFLFNIDDYDGNPVISDPNEKEIYGKWMKENYNCQLRKQQYTIAIGYLSPNEMDQDDDLRANFYGLNGRWGGYPEYVRGELNEGETAPTPLYQLNPNLFYYWTAISSVDRGLDGWEVQYSFLDSKYSEAYKFSSRYSYYKVAEKSPHAFIALRDVLDYSDTDRFPTAEYGNADKLNESRINNILAEYSSYGAANDDMNAALNEGGNAYLKAAKGYNDCLWNVIARNNQRFITQIDPHNTSAAYWRVAVTQTQPYGRFCRGFDVANNKNTMYFDVNDKYFEKNRLEEDGNLTVKIIHYAKDGGSWELQYHAQDSTMKSVEIVNDASKDWVSTEIDLSDALLDNGGENGADLILQNTDTTNCRFHLIEITLTEPPVAVKGVSIKSNSGTLLPVGNRLQLQAIVSPANAGNQEVTWTSLNPEIATVDSLGLVTAMAIGTATIEVTTIDGGFTASSEVEVIEAGEDFVLITSPSENDKFFFGQAVNVTAEGYDIDGIERMRFRVDGGQYKNDTEPPYEYTFNNLSLGTHTLEVQMKDSILPEAGRTLSAPVIIKVIPAPSSDASLSGLSVDGTTIADFSTCKEVYNIELPEGTSDVPVVRATATDVNADVQVTNAEGLPGSASVLVTAEDSVTTRTYTINFTVAAPALSIHNLNDSDNEFPKVYPNPVKEFLNIDFTTTGLHKINVFHSDGQLIHSIQTTGLSAKINLKAFNIEGLVFVQVKENNTVTNYKVIVE